MALVYLVFPCGFIRGALTNLGITAIVNADVTSLPGCTYFVGGDNRSDSHSIIFRFIQHQNKRLSGKIVWMSILQNMLAKNLDKLI